MRKERFGVVPPAKLYALAVFGVCLSLCAIVGVPLVRQLQRDASNLNSRGRLCQLVLAMRNYESDFGSLPPACVYDKQGRPMHSWRVLLLPYLELQTIYEQYEFDSSWNSDANAALAASLRDGAPMFFRSPKNSNGPTTSTDYVMVLDSHESSRVSDRVLLIEMSNSETHWMEPRDIPVDRFLSEWRALGPSGDTLNFVTTDGIAGSCDASSVRSIGSPATLGHLLGSEPNAEGFIPSEEQ